MWRVVEHVRRWYFNRFELVTKDSLQQAQDHLNRAVKNGKIGQNPYNDEEKLKISDAFLLFLAEKFRNVGEADSAREIFENMYPKNPDDAIILTSDFNTFEVDTDLEIALKIAKPYRDIARPIVAWILSEYQNAFKKGENEAKRKLKMTDKFDLDLIVHLFDTEIKAKCEEIDFGITEKILEKTRANPGRRLADESGDDRLIGSALPIRAVEATSSPSSIQRNVLATIHPKECQSNCAAQHPFAQVSSSSSAVSGQQDGINVATNNQSTPDYVITAPSLTSSSSIVETNSSGQTVEAARSSKRPRLNVGSYSAYFDDESENLRQIEKSLYALDSDESYEESPVSRPSTSMKSRNYGVRYNYQERVNDLLGQGIKVFLSNSGKGLVAPITVGSGKILRFNLSKVLVSAANLHYGDQIYFKVRLGPDFSYLTGEVVDNRGRGRGARLLLSKEKFEQSNGSNQVQKMYQFYVDPDRLECVQNIHEIITARSNSA